jgi:hypothetical protein
MNQIEQYTIENLAGSTSHITDRHKCLAALAYADNRGIDRATALRIILARRFQWLDWLTTTQSKWQSHTRNPNKARHHDSIALREKYVRC